MTTKKKKVVRETKVKRTGKVLSVYYQTSEQTAPYKHRHVGVEMEVADGEKPHEALLRAATFVHEQLGTKPPVLHELYQTVVVGTPKLVLRG